MVIHQFYKQYSNFIWSIDIALVDINEYVWFLMELIFNHIYLDLVVSAPI